MRTAPRLHHYLDASLVPPAPRPTVVVIDQDEDTCRILGLLLGTAGMTVVSAGDAATAARALAGRRAAVVISELRGRAALADVLLDGVVAQPALRGVPLVVHTSRVWPEDLARAKAAGAIAVFAKPARLASLLACVRMLAGASSRPGGKDEREHAARPRCGLDLDPPAVPLGDAAGDRQPQPGPSAS